MLIAGAGAAGLEAVLALRELAGDRVEVTVLADADELCLGPLALTRAFARPGPPRIPLAGLLEAWGVAHEHDSLASVRPRQCCVRTRAGNELPYDALLLATGALARPVAPGALTLAGARGLEAIARLLREIDEMTTTRVALALHRDAGWPAPLYELALSLAGRMAADGHGGAGVTLVTHESSPMAVLGARASALVGARLEAAGVRVLLACEIEEARPGEVALRPRGHLPAQRVIALPRLEGPPVLRRAP